MTTETMTGHDVEQQRDALVERLVGATTAVWDVFGVHLGSQLGLYEALAGSGGLTSEELAQRTGTAERYVREWLEHQATSGILEVEDPAEGPLTRRYRLPAGHVEPLVDRDSLNYIAPLAQLAIGCVAPIDQLVDAYRTGAGVPFEAYGRHLREGQGDMNRPSFLHLLGQEWLPAIPALDTQLRRPGARVADIGCGLGWSSIGIARAYPDVTVDGYDFDKPSIEAARENARRYGVADRVTFHAADAATATEDGGYALVTAFECIHDMSDPVGVLATMRRLAGREGTVLVMDERTGERFGPGSTEIEPLLYGFSMLHCLPAAMVTQPSAATGTVMRPGTLKEYATKAGFRDVEILPIENYFFYFYRLIP